MNRFDIEDTSSKLQVLAEKQLFFVCGVIKSGTTWLERLLDSHPRVVCKGEAHFSSDIDRPMTELFDRYNQEIVRKGGAVAHLKEYGGATDVITYEDADVNFLSRCAILLMFKKWIGEGDVDCVGDKTPGNLAVIPRLSDLFPRARFVHIVRDGRDVAVSLWYFNLKTDIARTIKQWGTFDVFASDFAANWAAQVESGRQEGQRLGDTRYIELTYERLISDPHGQLARVMQFLGIDSSYDTVNACVEACAFDKLSGGRNPGQEDSDSFYRKGVAGDWQNHFKDDLLRNFRAQAGHILDEFGYA